MYILDKIKECFNWFMGLLGFERVVGATRVVWRRRRKVNVEPRPVVNTGKPIDYLINDETTMNLVKRGMQIPVGPEKPHFVVKDYSGGGFSWGTVEWQAANVYTSIVNTMNWVNKSAATIGGNLLPDKWGGTNRLVVIPQAGIDLNAFYNRATMQFFFYHDKGLKKTIYTANSADIVTHELGHAILDTYRPGTWAAAYLEVWSFHEAFADFTAVLSLMQHDEVLNFALEQTGGDLNVNSCISRLAEEVGKAIFYLAPGSGRHQDYLRSAINDFNYVNPATLPKEAPHNELAAESHSFGRVFLGALYEMLVAIYEQTKAEGHTPLNALKHARDVMSQYIIKAIQNAPLNARFYESVAKTMLWADFSTHKKYHDLMRDILVKRNLISNEVKILSQAPECDNDDLVVRVQSTKTVKLSDHMVRAQSQEDNDLYDAEVELPQEEVFLYDADKNIYDSMACTEGESLTAAQDFVCYLHDNGLVGETNETPFEVTEGKLTRTFFA